MLSRIEHEVRAETLSYLRTVRKNRIAELRASLPPEDQELLLLRVDRQLSWNDLALVMCDEEEGKRLEGEALKNREDIQGACPRSGHRGGYQRANRARARTRHE
jgi:hypothetical protein